MEAIHRAMLSQFMARKLMSESVATKVLKALVEEGGRAPPLAAVVSTINKELDAVGMQVAFTDNAPGGAKHYAIVDTGSEQSTLATTLSQPELEMFLKIVRSALSSLCPPAAQPARHTRRVACRAARPPATHEARPGRRLQPQGSDLPCPWQVDATIANAETGAISVMEAVNLRAKTISAAEAQNVIDRLCEQGWLANRSGRPQRRRRSAAAAAAADDDDDESAEDEDEDFGSGGGISLGVRSFIDLKEYLKSAVTAPGAPTLDRVEYEASASPALAAGEAKVYFSPPEDEEFAILGYVVTCGQQTFRGASSPVSVSGLPHGTHTFTVKALNVGGSSDASAPSAGCKMEGAPIEIDDEDEEEEEAPAASAAAGGRRRGRGSAAAKAAPARKKSRRR
jgi:hypothetical protein